MTHHNRSSLVVRYLMTALLVLAAGTALAAKPANHKKHHPPGKALPIDGVWKGAWGTFEVKIERGRAYDFTNYGKPIGRTIPMVWWTDIRRVGPGRYTVVATGEGVNEQAGEQLTLSLLAEGGIALRTAIGDRVFTPVQLDDEKRYRRELEEALAEAARPAAPLEVAIGEASIELTRVETAPGGVIAPGHEFDLEVDTIITGVVEKTDSVDLVLEYAISRGGAVLYRSSPKRFPAQPGVAGSRTVHLAAAQTPGSYGIEVTVSFADGSTESTGRTSLLVGDTADVLKRFAGTWESQVPGNPPQRFDLKWLGDSLVFVRDPDQPVAKKNKVLDSSVSLDTSTLVIRVDMSSPNGDCLFSVEDRMPVGDDHQRLEGVATIVDGNWCIRIGETFNVIYTRVD